MGAGIFWKALAIGLTVAAPVGPMALLCIQRTLDRGQADGLLFGAGIAAADPSYAVISFAAHGLATLMQEGLAIFYR